MWIHFHFFVIYLLFVLDTLCNRLQAVDIFAHGHNHTLALLGLVATEEHPTARVVLLGKVLYGYVGRNGDRCRC